MTNKQWEYFCSFRESFKQKINEWNVYSDELKKIQEEINIKEKMNSYPIETPIVYNKNLDLIQKNDEIKLIVIGDNPGKNEQLLINNSYLVGQAGKLADNFFRNHQELQIDFRKNVIILNKTPIHTAKTNMIKQILSSKNNEIINLFNQTQIWMAQETAKLHTELVENSEGTFTPELWLVGYSELTKKGVFSLYKKTLLESYSQDSSATGFLDSWEKVFIFQHFSMNRFSIDLKNFLAANTQKKLSLKDSLNLLGKTHKNCIFFD